MPPALTFTKSNTFTASLPSGAAFTNSFTLTHSFSLTQTMSICNTFEFVFHFGKYLHPNGGRLLRVHRCCIAHFTSTSASSLFIIQVGHNQAAAKQSSLLRALQLLLCCLCLLSYWVIFEAVSK